MHQHVSVGFFQECTNMIVYDLNTRSWVEAVAVVILDMNEPDLIKRRIRSKATKKRTLCGALMKSECVRTPEMNI